MATSEELENEIYEVDKIIQKIYVKEEKTNYYLVSWVGYSEEYNEWFSEEELSKRSKQLLRGFNMNVQHPVYVDEDNWGEELVMEGIRGFIIKKGRKFYLIKWYNLIEDADSWITSTMAVKKDQLMVKDFEEKVLQFNIQEGEIFNIKITNKGTFTKHTPYQITQQRYNSINDQIEYLVYFNDYRHKTPDPNWCSQKEIPEKYWYLIDEFLQCKQEKMKNNEFLCQQKVEKDNANNHNHNIKKKEYYSKEIIDFSQQSYENCQNNHQQQFKSLENSHINTKAHTISVKDSDSFSISNDLLSQYV